MADLPRPDELKRLPRWARVANAARCARRVQPLFSALRPNAPEEDSIAIDEAITVAERSAAAADNAPAAASNAAAYASIASYNAIEDDDVTPHAASNAASAASSAAYSATAYSAAHDYGGGDAGALRAATAVNVGDWMKDAIWRDFDFLVRAAREGEWDDSTPVPPEFFGPLWPKGEPPGWPVKEASSADRELVVEIDVPADASDEDVIRTVCELADEADTLHRAYGGRGLQVNDVEVFNEAHVREGVPA